MNRSFHSDIRLSGSRIKLLACVSMFLDHLAKAFSLPDSYMFILSDLAGRLAFPLFCFLLTEGFFHTRNRLHYMRNLLLLAFLSEVPFDLMHTGKPFNWSMQNTCFTLFLGLLLFSILELLEKKKNNSRLLSFLIVILFMLLAQLLHVDYGAFGMALLTCLYLMRFTPYAHLAFPTGIFLMNLDAFHNVGAFLAVPFVQSYDGTRGKQNKWMFYLFYPGHLILLYLLAR